MEKRNIIGLGLMGLLIIVFMYFNGQTKAKVEAEQRIQDSISRVAFVKDSLLKVSQENTIVDNSSVNDTIKGNDSLTVSKYQGKYGPFAGSVAGVAQEVALENESLKIIFNSRGGNIKKVILKKYLDGKKFEVDSLKKQVELLSHKNNRFEYFIPVAGKGKISTQDLLFSPEIKGNQLQMVLKTSTGATFEQIYTLGEGYNLDYQVKTKDFNQILASGTNDLQLHWVNHIKGLERGQDFEDSYSSVYWREIEGEKVDHCKCRGNADDAPGKSIDWISHTQQFFNTTLIAKDKPFNNPSFKIEDLDNKSGELKVMTSDISIPTGDLNEVNMLMYLGPNEFKTLQSFDKEIENIIPYGNSFFGMLNRTIIRPVFEFLLSKTGSAGWSIILLTLLVKLIVFPLTYKMIRSQTKMSLLKPMLEKIRGKNKDQSQVQMETMKLYQETGVSPFGGCMPMLLQMPIWFALYRFFPANIQFRQESFLWAHDLSTFDDFFKIQLPFDINHISLFAILWAVSTLVYTWYNTKYVNPMANASTGGGELAETQMKMMQYMQYVMPVMFLFFFNSYASGLTAYLLFSNLLNIFQTVMTKAALNKDTLQAEIDNSKNKPKKKAGFAAKMEEMMKQQQLNNQNKK